MNPKLLLAHFNRISDVPHAVPRFRRFVLDLAVRGKLVEQDRKDEPASQLLKRIQAEWQRLFGEGTVKNANLSREIQVDEMPYSIPNSWQWVRLGQCLKMINGRAFKPTDWRPAGLPIVRIQNLNSEDAPFNYCDESIVEPRHIIESGHFLISWSGTPGTSFGAFIWKRGKAALNQHIFKCGQIGGAYYDRFLQIAINGRLDEMIAKAHGGVGLQHITKGKLEYLPLSLPPLAEQHRIVTKVDELMALCDRLQAQRVDRESQRDRLTASSLHGLNNGANAEDFRAHARFHLDHFSLLTARAEQVQQFRRTVLSLAVRGQLVSPEPNDESATALLQRIQAEKARQIKDGILRKEKPLPPLTDHEKPFPVPSGWMWARVGAMSLLTDYGTSVKSNLAETGVPVLSMGDIQGGMVILGAQKKVPREIEDLPRLFLKRLDLLYNRTNSAELVGKTGIYMGDDDAYTFASYLIRIRFLSDLTSPVYANLAMNAPYFRATQIVPGLQQQCGQANVNGTKLRNMLIPVPPLEEQHRIVAKVAELMSLCDQLEGQLSDSEDRSRRLLEAVLFHALNDSHDTGKWRASCSVS
jgi:type I restriction enzyme S subunit